MVGGEFLVNTTAAGDQFLSAATMNDVGDFVVAWDSVGQDGDGHGVFGRRFAADGTPLAGEFPINTNTAGDQLFPELAADANGNFIAVWESEGVTGRGIAAQRFDSAGMMVGGEFRVNTTTDADQLTPAVAMNRGGQSVVVWDSFGQDGDGQGIFGQRYDADGNSVGAEFPVNSQTTGNQLFPDVAMADDGSFVAVWESSFGDGDGSGVFGQRFAADGSAVGNQFPINTQVTGNQIVPSVAMNPDGRFVVVWDSEVVSGHEIHVRRYEADGTPVGGVITVNQQSGAFQAAPQVEIDAFGNFVVTWDRFQADGDGRGILARRYNWAGTPLVDEILVNTTTDGNQAFPVVADARFGNFVVIWESLNDDNDGLQIYGQRFNVNQPPVAVDDAATTSENSAVSTDVIANDADVDNFNQDLTLVSIDSITVDGLSTGNLLIDATLVTSGRQIVFDPVTDFDELDPGDQSTIRVEYTMSDPSGETSSATLTITVNGVNDGPVAIDDSASTTENTPISVAVLDNDTDIDLDDSPANFTVVSIDTLSVTGLSTGSSLVNATVTIVGNQVLFDPATDFDELDSGDLAAVVVQYSMSDDSGGTASAELIVEVFGLNDTPVAEDDTAATTENQAIDVDVVGNDSDVDLDDQPASFTVDSLDSITVAGLSTGAALITAQASIVNNSVRFDPVTDFDELDEGDTATVAIGHTMSDREPASSSAQLLITVTGENDTPVAVADSSTTSENQSVTHDVLANDTDVDLDDEPSNFSVDRVNSIVVSGISSAPRLRSGSVRIVDNHLEFDPGTDFDELDAGDTATVVVYYSMSDTRGARSTSTWTISVNGEPDAPVAVVDVITTTENAGLSVPVLANDRDVDADDDPQNFLLVSFTEPQVTGLSTGSSLIAAALTIDGASARFEPSTDFDELDTGDVATVRTVYTMSDAAGNTSSAELLVNVLGVNDAPVAVNDTATTFENESVLVDVLSNDTDIDGDDGPRNFSVDAIEDIRVSSPVIDPSMANANANVEIVGKQILFDPGTAFGILNDGQTATVTIDYLMSDNEGATSRAALVITVQGRSSSLSGFVYADVDNDGVKDQPEIGIPGVAVTISGPVEATTTTAADGSYHFEDLPTGVYTISEQQPTSFEDGKETRGTPASGSVENDQFVGVFLDSGVDAVDYNFGEFSLLITLTTKRLLLTNTPPATELVNQFVDGQISAFDVNVDGRVTAQDALTVINHFALSSVASAEQTAEATRPSRLDVNRDGRVTASDALMVINRLAYLQNASAANPENATLTSDRSEFEAWIWADWLIGSRSQDRHARERGEVLNEVYHARIFSNLDAISTDADIDLSDKQLSSDELDALWSRFRESLW